jgi:hypothetical protein
LYIEKLKGIAFVDDYFIDIAGSWFDELNCSGNSWNHYCTLCSFYVSVYTRRGISPQMFADIFDVNVHSVWEHSSKVLENWRGKPWYNDLIKLLNTETERFDRLKRSIYGLWFIDCKKHFTLIKTCDKLWSRIQRFPQIRNLKSNSLYCTLVIIAVKSCQIDVDINILCEHFNVTLCTVKQNEILIQQAVRSRF